MLLLGLKTTKILPTKPWHKRDISDSGLEICQAGGAANSCETCFFFCLGQSQTHFKDKNSFKERSDDS